MIGIDLDFQGSGNKFSEDVFPVQAVDWLAEESLAGNGFNYFPWGGYLLYRLWPENLVFIDGQTDFYGEELTRQYEQVLTLQSGWQEVFNTYEIQWVIMPTESALSAYLADSANWETVYQDQTARVFCLKGK
jgi:hypothetical protein